MRAWTQFNCSPRGSGKVDDSIPSPPAPLTAAASSGVPVPPPMTASWIGTRHPTSLVNAVSNSVVTFATLQGGHQSMPRVWGPRGRAFLAARSMERSTRLEERLAVAMRPARGAALADALQRPPKEVQLYSLDSEISWSMTASLGGHGPESPRSLRFQ